MEPEARRIDLGTVLRLISREGPEAQQLHDSHNPLLAFVLLSTFFRVDPKAGNRGIAFTFPGTKCVLCKVGASRGTGLNIS